MYRLLVYHINTIRFLLFATLLSCQGSTSRTYFENGKIKDEGVMKFGKKEGIWKSWDKEGQMVAVAHFKNDTLRHVDFYYNNDHKQSSKSFNYNGLEHGKCEIWDINGQLRHMGIYDSGRMVGKWVSFYENGKQLSITQYDKNGRKNGYSVFFGEEGDTLKKVLYENDSLTKEILFKGK